MKTGAPLLSASPGVVRLQIRVTPRSSRATVGDVREHRLIVRVTAPPVDGAANEAVIELLSGKLGLPRRAISIVSGQTGREKTVAIEGVTESFVRERLRLP